MILSTVPLDFNESHFHPSVIHFPIALILAGYMMYCIYVFRKRRSRKFAMYCYYVLVCAALSALVAAFTGIFYTHTSDFSEKAVETLMDHRFWAMCTTLLVSITAVIKIFAYFTTTRNIQTYDWQVFAFYTLTAICTIMTAVRGTTLVFVDLRGPLFLP